MEWKPDTEAWRRSYAERGYLVVENVVEPSLLVEMRDALERIEQAVAEETLSPSLRRWITLERDRVDRYTDRVTSSMFHTTSRRGGRRHRRRRHHHLGHR